jgi:hypothetical protein
MSVRKAKIHDDDVFPDTVRNRELAKRGELKSESVESVPTMKLEIVTFRVVGVSPLLQNNPADFIGKVEGDPGLGAKKVYDDAEEARRRLYRDADGNCCHLAEAFVKAAVKAVTRLRFGKLAAPAVLRGAVFITETLCVLEDEHGEPLKDYAIDRRSVVVGKARVLRCRPSWMPWRATVAVEVDTALCSPGNVLQAWSLAGRKIGVGDNRPEKGGPNGRYTATLLG